MHEPSIKETAFDCPHCGAYATQYWHDAYVELVRTGSKIPLLPSDDFKEKMHEILRKMCSPRPFLLSKKIYYHDRTKT